MDDTRFGQLEELLSQSRYARHRDCLLIAADMLDEAGLGMLASACRAVQLRDAPRPVLVGLYYTVLDYVALNEDAPHSAQVLALARGDGGYAPGTIARRRRCRAR